MPRTWAFPYVVLWALAGLLPIQATDLDIFFWPSAKLAVAGHPLLVYSAGGQAAYPNANGPVALLPLTLVGLLVRSLGWLDAMPQRRAIALAVFSLFLVLMAKEGVAAIERLRGSPLTTYPRLFTYATLALSPPIWQSVLGYGHIEQPIEAWLLLLSARWLNQDRTVRGGVAFGLAVLTRSSSILMSVPLALAARHRGWRRLITLGLATSITGAAGLLPFYLADRANVTHSLFTYRGSLIVGAGSIWSLTHGRPLEAVVQHWDVAAVALAVVATNLWLATRPGGFDQARLLAGMALTSASFALLAKTVWPYYFFEVFVLATVWAFGRWRPADGIIRLVMPSIAISTLGLLAEVGSEQGLPDFLVGVEGGGMFVLLGLTAAWMVWMAGQFRPRPAGIAGAAAALQQHGSETGDDHARHS